MPVAAIRARVVDFPQFKEAHDHFLERMDGRLRTALLMHRLYQSAEDPYEILIIDQWVNIEAAQSVYSGAGFRDADMNKAVVGTPQWSWYIETEAKKIGP